MIQSLKLASYRGFSDTTIKFSDITCIVGENSTGKSTIIQTIQDLLSSNNPIPPNHCKAGIPDNNTTSLSLAFQDGRKLSKNIQKVERGDDNSLPKCITSISPIPASYSFSLTNGNDVPIKNQNITDVAWQSILSHCDFTLKTIAALTDDPDKAWRFNKEHSGGMLEKFTNTFNNILSGSIGRKYEFEIFFHNTGSQLVVKLNIFYRESDRESDKQSSWV